MTPTREELLTCLTELSEVAPDLRLGQLVANLATLAEGAKVEAICEKGDASLNFIFSNCEKGEKGDASLNFIFSKELRPTLPPARSDAAD